MVGKEMTEKTEIDGEAFFPGYHPDYVLVVDQLVRPISLSL